MTCSQTARKLQEPLIGTAPVYKHYICIEDKQSQWKQGITGSATQKKYNERYEHLDVFFSLINGLEKKFVRPILIDQDREEDEHCIFIYSLHEGTYRCYTYTIDSLTSVLSIFCHYLFYHVRDVPDAIHSVLKPIAEKFDKDQFLCMEDVTPRIFVCNHNVYDRCCSRGKVIHDEITSHGIESWRCSHIGGHRFAATLVSMPEARYYGQIEVADVPAFLKCAYVNKPFLKENKYRGLATVNPKLQNAEHLAWTRDTKEDDTIKSVWVKDDVSQVYIKRTYTSGDTEYFAVMLKEKQSSQLRPASCSKMAEGKEKPWTYFVVKDWQKITAG
ncbi:sucrase ferredoxin [Candidatus Uabimicrobium amorphum]|uniref:Sucrase ferredoxin n=1 Tax=Uabimicrobium amorphum TaxID=2596890 RepID=A0A5S9IIQ3_UABAM|nr:sucrase ferredoxin [Candidatus Uabimicrobium amorphum]BBM82424.1 sucrase ferredoxin [Candidatus Uabimicrobium amorphum]